MKVNVEVLGRDGSESQARIVAVRCGGAIGDAQAREEDEQRAARQRHCGSAALCAFGFRRTSFRNVNAAIGESFTPSRSGWYTATLVLYHRADIRHVVRNHLLRLRVQRPPRLVVDGDRSGVDQSIDFRIHGRRRGSDRPAAPDSSGYTRRSMSGSVTPTNCSVYIWKLPRTTSAKSVCNSLDRTSTAMPTARQVVLNGSRLHAIDLRRRGLQRQSQAGLRAVAVGIGKPGRVEQPRAPRSGSWRKSKTFGSNAHDIGGTMPTATVANPRRR